MAIVESEVIEGQYRVLGESTSGEDTSGISRRGVFGRVAALAASFALGRVTAGGQRESSPQGGEATIVIAGDFPRNSVLREAYLQGERTQLTNFYDSNVYVNNRRIDMPESFGLTHIQAAYGPVFQLDIPVVILQKIPLSNLTVKIGRSIGDVASFSTTDVINILNAQHPDHPTTQDDKVSIFFYQHKGKKGNLARHIDGKIVPNVIPVSDSLANNNLNIQVRIDHTGNPKFDVDSYDRSAGWVDQSEGRGFLEMVIKPKAIGPTKPLSTAPAST